MLPKHGALHVLTLNKVALSALTKLHYCLTIGGLFWLVGQSVLAGPDLHVTNVQL